MATVPAEDVPFGGRGAAGAAWKVALGLLGAAAGLVVVYAALAAQVLADGDLGDQDARSWQALGAIAFAAVAAIAAFAAWSAGVTLAAFGRGRLARPVLGLFLAVAVPVAVLSAVVLPTAVEPALPAVTLVAALAGGAGAVRAWRRPTAPSP